LRKHSDPILLEEIINLLGIFSFNSSISSNFDRYSNVLLDTLPKKNPHSLLSLSLIKFYPENCLLILKDKNLLSCIFNVENSSCFFHYFGRIIFNLSVGSDNKNSHLIKNGFIFSFIYNLLHNVRASSLLSNENVKEEFKNIISSIIILGKKFGVEVYKNIVVKDANVLKEIIEYIITLNPTPFSFSSETIINTPSISDNFIELCRNMYGNNKEIYSVELVNLKGVSVLLFSLKQSEFEKNIDILLLVYEILCSCINYVCSEEYNDPSGFRVHLKELKIEDILLNIFSNSNENEIKLRCVYSFCKLGQILDFSKKYKPFIIFYGEFLNDYKNNNNNNNINNINNNEKFTNSITSMFTEIPDGNSFRNVSFAFDKKIIKYLIDNINQNNMDDFLNIFLVFCIYNYTLNLLKDFIGDISSKISELFSEYTINSETFESFILGFSIINNTSLFSEKVVFDNIVKNKYISKICEFLKYCEDQKQIDSSMEYVKFSFSLIRKIVEFKGILETIPEEDIKLLISRLIAVFEFPKIYHHPHYFYHSARALYKIFKYGAEGKSDNYNLYHEEFIEKLEVYKGVLISISNILGVYKISRISSKKGSVYDNDFSNIFTKFLKMPPVDTLEANLPSFGTVEDRVYRESIINCEKEEDVYDVENNSEIKETEKYIVLEIHDLFFSLFAFCMKGINIGAELSDDFDIPNIRTKIVELQLNACRVLGNSEIESVKRKLFFQEYNDVLKIMYTKFIEEYN
jgi:hypothetical protein